MSESQKLPNSKNVPDPNVPPSNMKAASAEPAWEAIDPSQTPPVDTQPNSTTVEEAKLTVIKEQDKSSEMSEALAWQSDADVAELISLSDALRQQNSDLMAHVEELETLLEECHSALQLQVQRSQNTESQLAQQNNQLEATQEQLTRLFRELEASHQVAQRQQILTETLTDQLQSSQERVAQLERQCAAIQQRYNEQSQMLLQSETACSELQDRLQRQQRYTLQFKAALDKCLEMPGTTEVISSSISTPVTPTVSSDLPRFSVKPQPIRPWSAKSDSTSSDTEDENSEASPTLTPINREAEEIEPENLKKSAENSFINPFFGVVEPEVILELAGNQEVAVEEAIEIEATEEVLWAELERLTREAVSPATPISKDTVLNIDPESDLFLELPEPIEQIAEEQERSILEVVPRSSDLVPATATASQRSKSPSPVVYPQRTPKKIKSLAAIDLPTFPRINQK